MIADRWGVTAAEVTRAFPCDEVVPSPGLQLWRGVGVDAPPERVWPWVRQLRLAPYSYDWVDNAGRRSPRELRDLPDPRPGEPFTRVAGAFACGRVVSVVPREHLTAEIMGVVMSYVVVGEGATTRLLLKVVARRRRWWGAGLAVGDLVMARRQLLNLARLAEGTRGPQH